MKLFIAATLLFTAFLSQAQTVSTFAGSGTQGSTDGTGTGTTFNNPHAICVDPFWNFYIADRDNHKIRKITPAGVVTTFAGSGTAGGVDGTGTGASFNFPQGLCSDSVGNIYVADTYNHKIRKISPLGAVTTIAGTGFAGSANGTGTSASFTSPTAVCSDTAGNIFVVENNKIRKIAPGGVVTNFAGTGFYGSQDGPGSTATFYNIIGICTDNAGNMYVADRQNYKIRKITPAGVVSTYAGAGTQGSVDGPSLSATFNLPVSVCADITGDIYVTEVGGQHKIRKISTAGMVSTIAGSGQGNVDGSGSSAKFNFPRGICVDASGDLYVADGTNHKIRKITLGSVGIHEASNNNKVVIYPNPANDLFFIESTDVIRSVIIIDMNSKIVFEDVFHSKTGTINIGSLNSGHYFIKMIDVNNSEMIVKELVIEK